MGGLGGNGDERSSESGFSDDLFVFVGFVGKAHATFRFQTTLGQRSKAALMRRLV